MKNITKYLGLLIVPVFCLSLCSCEERYDPNPSEADQVWVKNIKMVVNGKEIAGKINENKKEILFPKQPSNTKLSNISFKGDLPTGAKFSESSYDFTPAEGDASTKKTIKIVNNKRFREYYVTINLSVPPTGADFAGAKRYNYALSGSVYPSFADVADSRAADIDLQHVLIASRSTPIHLLKLEDLKKGVITRIDLNSTGLTGGTYARNAGRLVNGHAYVCNLTTGFATSPFKVYHWDTSSPDTPPTVVAEYIAANCAGDTPHNRYGDFMSIDLDENGNGYIFSQANSGSVATSTTVLRIKVTNFTTTSNPTIITTTAPGWWATYNAVDGVKDLFLHSGNQASLKLVNEGGQTIYNVPTSAFGLQDGGGAYIVNFNKDRYLITLNDLHGAGMIAVYNVSKGATIQEALEIYVGGDVTARAPLITQSLGGAIPSGNNAVGIGWARKGDETLYILGAAASAGFAILELSKATEKDPFDTFVED